MCTPGGRGKKNWYAKSCCQIILQNWPIDSNIPLPHVGHALWGKKGSKSFPTACFITNNFVTMTVLAHLLCHSQGWDFFRSLSCAGKTEDRELPVLLLLCRSSNELWEIKAS